MKRVLFDSDIFTNGNYEEAKGEFEDPENCFDDVCQLANDWTYDDYLWFIKDFHKCVKPEDSFISRKEDYVTPYGDYYTNAHNVGYMLYGNDFKYEGFYSLESSFGIKDDIKLEDVNGHLFYEQADHDGRIYQELRELTDAGYGLYDRWVHYEGNLQHLSQFEIFDKLWNDSHYSRLPRLADRIFNAQSIESYKMAAQGVSENGIFRHC